jgi:hypothetical protein
MSYYFAIIGTKDNPIFEHEFGTSKQGGDGVARFPEQAKHMNQFIVHSSLDVVEEVQWGGGQMCVHFLFASSPPPVLFLWFLSTQCSVNNVNVACNQDLSSNHSS